MLNECHACAEMRVRSDWPMVQRETRTAQTKLVETMNNADNIISQITRTFARFWSQLQE